MNSLSRVFQKCFVSLLKRRNSQISYVLSAERGCGKAQPQQQHWENGALTQVSVLLAKYDAATPSLAAIHQYLEKARQTLGALPESHGRTCLLALTNYLARQTEALFVSESGV